ncbi:VCBS repeat-containing protein [Streptomyces sp. SCSIO 30461]|uniref:FG-GAP repeat domain-containing protein n=1 Tax=Streptomyces sp. SCSIO 30461 TaxID=3118085 RepID=UPI0030CB1DCE
MRTRLRRAAAIATAAACISGPLVLAPAAAADSEPLVLAADDQVAAPGASWLAEPWQASGPYRSGTMVFALSTEALTGTIAADAVLPDTFILQDNDCKTPPGTHGVYTCERGPLSKGYRKLFFHLDDSTRNVTVHFGYAWVPTGGDVSAAVQSVQKSESSPEGATHGHALLKVVTPATSAARNTVAFDTPAVPAGRSVRHKLRVHATDPGKIYTYYLPSDGQPNWRRDEVAITDVTTSPGISCARQTRLIFGGGNNLACEASSGDHTIEYTLTAPPGMDTWRIATHVVHDIYQLAPYGSALDRTSTFTAGTGTLHLRHQLLARDTSGSLYRFAGTGKPTTPLSTRSLIGTGWQTYNQITKLDPVSEDLRYLKGVPAGAQHGHGDLVARDAKGTLWYYQRQFTFKAKETFKARVKVGTGWNAYDTLTGAGDVNGDKRSDLLARDKTGVLWLYKGTGKPSAPFATRVRVGGGWQAYNRLAGSADLTGDTHPDLLARDKTGVLWLYKGTGKPSAPFATRVRVGGGWQTYDALSVVGDLTDNGKADLIARDGSGALWLYKGTGRSSAPLATRTKIATSGKGYNNLL